MNNLSLALPNDQMETMALEFKKEFFDNGEKVINGSNRLDMDKYTYSQWLEIISGLNANVGDSASDFSHTYFAVQEDGGIVGIVNFRHPLIGFFADTGHIGYSVRPTQRMKGYATEILRQSLMLAKKQGLTEVYLVCKKDNEPSRKTIQRNNGILSRTFMKNEHEYEEYTITL